MMIFQYALTSCSVENMTSPNLSMKRSTHVLVSFEGSGNMRQDRSAGVRGE